MTLTKSTMNEPSLLSTVVGAWHHARHITISNASLSRSERAPNVILYFFDPKALTIKEKNYPAQLKEIYDPPAILYYKGNIKALSPFSIAVVGTRKISDYGKHVTQILVRDLSKNNLTIVSGLALGIDSQAHITCLENKGTTIAVLGSGLDKNNIYPSSNRYLAQKIIGHNGAIVSEYPIGTMPLRHNFPLRNRIISGLSLGVIVIEAGEVSGSLITAN